MLPPVSWTESAEEHIARHHVAPDEVEEVLYGRPRYLAPGRSGTRLVFGATAAGRHLLVVLSDAPDGGGGHRDREGDDRHDRNAHSAERAAER